MAFVNEKIGDKWRTIDHEKMIILQQGGGVGTGGPYIFTLSYKSQEIGFHAARRTGPYINKMCDVWWDVMSIEIPKEISDDREDIVATISDALNAYGIAATRDHVGSVTVNFSSDLI